MKNFIFKSTDADLQKMFSIIENTQRNVLYLTHQVDFIRKRITAWETDKRLQTQVDEYFGSNSDNQNSSENIPDTAEV